MKLVTIQRAADLTERDIYWLTKGCAAVKFRHMEAMKLIHQMLDGKSCIFRIEGENCEGVAVVSPDNWENELWIDLYAGRNVMGQELRELLKIVARRIGLKKLTGYVGRQALGHWYDHNVTAKPVAALYVEEVD